MRKMGFLSARTSDEMLSGESNDADTKLIADGRSKEGVNEKDCVLEF